jgi:hypothetical protein
VIPHEERFEDEYHMIIIVISTLRGSHCYCGVGHVTARRGVRLRRGSGTIRCTICVDAQHSKRCRAAALRARMVVAGVVTCSHAEQVDDCYLSLSCEEKK